VRPCLYLLLALLLGACNTGDTPPGSLQLDQLAGRWVVINYWATWCKPCIQEIPELNALDEQYQQVSVLGVNYDGANGEELQRQIQDLDISFQVLTTDPAVQLGIPRPVVLPTTLVIDPSGQLRQTLVGPQTLQSLARATEQAADNPDSH
jgi:thiol-disulfide isomerase/thioredoxin